MDPAILFKLKEGVEKNLASLRVSLEIQGGRQSQQSPVFIVWRARVREHMEKIKNMMETHNYYWIINEMEGETKSLMLEQLNNMVRHDSELGLAGQFGEFDLYWWNNVFVIGYVFFLLHVFFFNKHFLFVN